MEPHSPGGNPSCICCSCVTSGKALNASELVSSPANGVGKKMGECMAHGNKHDQGELLRFSVMGHCGSPTASFPRAPRAWWGPWALLEAPKPPSNPPNIICYLDNLEIHPGSLSAERLRETNARTQVTQHMRIKQCLPSHP